MAKISTSTMLNGIWSWSLNKHYTKDETDQLVAAIKQFQIVVTDSLPTASASTMYKIYLIPSSNAETQNTKDEYITLENSGSYTWEQIGTTAVDLSGYEQTANKAASSSGLDSTSSTQYPSSKAMVEYIAANTLNESSTPVQYMARLIVQQQKEIEGIKASLEAAVNHIDAKEYRSYGIPTVLYSSTAGSPSSSIVPDNWSDDFGVWMGYPFFEGQVYVDKSTKKVYMAVKVTASTGDWVVLN